MRRRPAAQAAPPAIIAAIDKSFATANLCGVADSSFAALCRATAVARAGHGSSRYRMQPMNVGPLDGLRVIACSAGSKHAIAITSGDGEEETRSYSSPQTSPEMGSPDIFPPDVLSLCCALGLNNAALLLAHPRSIPCAQGGGIASQLSSVLRGSTVTWSPWSVPWRRLSIWCEGNSPFFRNDCGQ